MTPPSRPLEIVRRDAEFVLYRIPDTVEPRLAKAVAFDPPSAASLERLVHEYALRDELDPQWAVRPLDLVRRGSRTILLLADPGGKPLDGLLGQPMEPSLFLRIASTLAAALAHLHARGIVHKDIKPANVLVDAHSGTVHLMGFGIASRLPRERQALARPEDIAGTLAYMAPEQTGRMNRSIDSRSDLYALGVSFYEMLTGGLPFTASDPMELFHCHLARQAIPPAERAPGVPETLSAIVMKLLAKAADERYQTAAGLEADLRRCLAQWQSQGHIDVFPLGAHDASAQLLIPEKLYGREAEIAILVTAFDRVVAGGKPELVLVSGYAGIGKSALVGELHQVLVPRRGLFAAGKFDQYQRGIPYATLAQACRALVRQILGQSEAQVDQWRDALQAALSTNGQLVVKLIPELELLIGKQPPVQELPPQEAHSRFQTVLRRFLGVFAQPAHPLVLFLDDLQWLDTATLELLEYLIDDPDLRYLLLIGAYRDNEVNALHPLMRTLDTMRRARQVALHEIVLAPLALNNVVQLVADTLHCAREHNQGLAALVYEKSGGNPFFTIQFLTALAEEGLLAFEPQAAAWNWDIARIRAKGFTDNVVDLMLGKLHRLPAATQDALKLLACLGSSAATANLSLLHGASEAQLHFALWEAVRTGLVFRSDGTYVFLHDRIREAAYSLVPESARAAEHLRIGRLLASQTAPQEIEDKIFEIVNQFNRGVELIALPDEREQLAELNLVAGRRARDSTAYAAALTYLATGCALLATDSWARRYALAFGLAFHRAECEYLTGDLAAAEQRLAVLTERAANHADLAAVTCVRVNLFTTIDRFDRAVEAGRDYLRRVGVQWSSHPTKDDVQQEFERIWQQVGRREIEELIDLPLMNDPNRRATMDVLTTMLPPTLFSDENLLGLVVGRMANLSLEHGHSDGSCLAYVWLGLLLGPRFGNYQAGFRFGKLGLDLVEKRGLDRFKARVYLDFSHVVNPWAQHVNTGPALARRAFNAANDIGDLTFAAYSCCNLITALLAAGDPLAEVQREAENGFEFARKAHFGLITDIMTAQLRLIKTLRGLSPSFSCFNDAEFDEDGFEAHLEEGPRLAVAICWYWVRKLQARFFAGDYASAVAAAAKTARFLWTVPSHIEVAEYHFYGALARAAHYQDASPEVRTQYRAALAAHRRQLAEWAHNCPENFANRAALVDAEIARIEGRDLDAMHLYEQAIRSARENGLVHNEGLAYERAAAFYRTRGFDPFADTYLRQARDCYARWGADGKVRQLEARHVQLQARPEGALATPLAQLDLLSVAKASQAISGQIVLDELVDTLMRIVIENAGAQTGYLILVREAQLALAAQIQVEQQAVRVQLHREPGLPASALPTSMLNYVQRSGEPVLLADAAASHPFSADPYFFRHRPKSVLCLPILRQAALIGLLYLENNLATHAFAAGRVAVLEVLASQAAISLENAHLYTDLQQENSERKRAEAALREREARIRQLVESNIIGIFFFDLHGNISEANDAFLRMIGYSRGDLRAGKIQWTALTPAAYRALDEQKVAEVRRTRTCTPYEKEYIRKDGSRLAVLIGGTLFEGSQEHGVAFVLDLTERRQAEAERAARKSAEAANAAKSTFLANMSHELRSPLNTLLGFARLMERQPALPLETKEDLAIILRSGEHLRTLINQVLDLAKIEAGREVLHETAFDLHAMLEELEDMFAFKAQDRGLALRFEQDAVPHFVRGDPLKLRQVLINLLGNALKFTQQGGVTVRIARLTAPAGRRVRFAVADTGPGMAAEELRELFNPFVQTGTGRQTQEGTGLGLTISRNFVRLMGGELHIDSQVGRGTTVGFDLPLQAIDVAAVAAPPERAARRVVGLAPGQPRYRILVADDRPEARQLLVRLLAPLGFDVREAANGQEAVDSWHAWQPHLIWMDMRMPVLDGRDATRRIKASAGGQATAIIALTASSFEEERTDILAAGCDGFLRKPFQEADLFALMQKHLGVRFVYREALAAAEHASVQVDAAALAALPAAVRTMLEQALLRLDTAAVTNAIGAVPDAPLAQALAVLADEFQYNRMLHLIQGSERKEQT